MAKSPITEAAPEVDAIDGVALPRERMGLIGHQAAEAELLDAYRSGRIHHAWVFGGTKGIGKATLAFRLARFVLAHPDPASPAVQTARDLSVAADHPVARRVANGSHIDLLHLRRPWDEKAKRFKTELPVDEIRRTVGFFGSTAGEGGWRIAIVDPADDLNANAANALLKILEEPPARCLFLVIAHQPGRLLPTIRSRCRRLILDGLAPAAIMAGFDDLGLAGFDPGAMEIAAEIADGSLRRAILLLANDGVRLFRAITGLAAKLPALDLVAVHKLADEVAARGADEAFEVAVEVLSDVAAARARAAATGVGAASRWAEAHDAILRHASITDSLNLDRKSVILSAFRTLAEAARN